jgi:hypothetical protein
MLMFRSAKAIELLAELYSKYCSSFGMFCGFGEMADSQAPVRVRRSFITVGTVQYCIKVGVGDGGMMVQLQFKI